MVFKIFLLLAVHGFLFWCLGNGQACNSLGFICTSCTSFELCTDGVPGTTVLSCSSSGYYCDSTASDYCSTTVCTTDPPSFYNCITAGRFAVSSNCSQYVFCSNNTAGVLVPALYECPNGTVFNPYTAKCVLTADYACVDGATTTEATIIEGSCTTSGRYPYGGTSCQSYYYCILQTNGTYTLSNQTCPTTTVFNPTTQKCVLPTAYTCSD